MNDHLDLRALLIRHEGLRLQVYDDATGDPVIPGYRLIGHPTIGVGRALDVQGITEADAQLMLSEDIERVLKECRDQFIWFSALSPVRQNVVASMVFQMGIAGFKHFVHMIAAVQVGDYESASREMIASAWFNQVPARARELAQMMRDNE